MKSNFMFLNITSVNPFLKLPHILTIFFLAPFVSVPLTEGSLARENNN